MGPRGSSGSIFQYSDHKQEFEFTDGHELLVAELYPAITIRIGAERYEKQASQL
jgi:hypothetical protein